MGRQNHRMLPIQAGYFADQYVVKTEVLLYNDELIKRVEKVGNRVARGAAVDYPEAADVQFTFCVINSPEINAMATAGGFLYIKGAARQNIKRGISELSRLNLEVL